MNNSHSGLIVGAICARGGSKGVPRKNLRLLAGVPLIAHTILCAQQSPVLQRVIVSTEDPEIAEVARKYGAEVPFVRPASLAQDDSSKWHVFRHLVQTMEEKEGGRIEVLVDLDTGVPLRKPTDIQSAVRQLLTSEADVLITAYQPERNPYFNMVEPDGHGYFRVVKPLHPPVTRRQAAPPVYALSPAVYAIRREALWKYDHWSQAKMQIYELERERAIDIDHEIDFRFIEFLMQTLPAR
jgi:CMP-N,N'-diacetyllegionaminic acid synthase